MFVLSKIRSNSGSDERDDVVVAFLRVDAAVWSRVRRGLRLPGCSIVAAVAGKLHGQVLYSWWWWWLLSCWDGGTALVVVVVTAVAIVVHLMLEHGREA